MPTLTVNNHGAYTAKMTLTYSADGNNTIPSPPILEGQSWTPSVPDGATDIQLVVDPVGGHHPLTKSLPAASTWGDDYEVDLRGTVNHPKIGE